MPFLSVLEVANVLLRGSLYAPGFFAKRGGREERRTRSALARRVARDAHVVVLSSLGAVAPATATATAAARFSVARGFAESVLQAWRNRMKAEPVGAALLLLSIKDRMVHVHNTARPGGIKPLSGAQTRAISAAMVPYLKAGRHEEGVRVGATIMVSMMEGNDRGRAVWSWVRFLGSHLALVLATWWVYVRVARPLVIPAARSFLALVRRGGGEGGGERGVAEGGVAEGGVVGGEVGGEGGGDAEGEGAGAEGRKGGDDDEGKHDSLGETLGGTRVGTVRKLESDSDGGCNARAPPYNPAWEGETDSCGVCLEDITSASIFEAPEPHTEPAAPPFGTGGGVAGAGRIRPRSAMASMAHTVLNGWAAWHVVYPAAAFGLALRAAYRANPDTSMAMLGGTLAIVAAREMNMNRSVDSGGGEEGAVDGDGVDRRPSTLATLNAGGNTFTLVCGHTFHKTCIMRWNQRSSLCPLCRAQFTLPGGAPIRGVSSDGDDAGGVVGGGGGMGWMGGMGGGFGGNDEDEEEQGRGDRMYHVGETVYAMKQRGIGEGGGSGGGGAWSLTAASASTRERAVVLSAYRDGSTGNAVYTVMWDQDGAPHQGTVEEGVDESRLSNWAWYAVRSRCVRGRRRGEEERWGDGEKRREGERNTWVHEYEWCISTPTTNITF
jgi:hypothetical protein